jgi:hypothetical protein
MGLLLVTSEAQVGDVPLDDMLVQPLGVTHRARVAPCLKKINYSRLK